MAIKVSIFGSNKDSDEYKAAVKLKRIIVETTPENAAGEVVIFANATLYGQTVKDVDLIVLGSLEDYAIEANFYDEENKQINAKVEIKSFCTVVEVKSHGIGGIMRNGTNFYVMYGKKIHCVTTQSNNQKISAKNFFEEALTVSPFITNVIWFTQVTPSEVNGLLDNSVGRISSNVLGSQFAFKGFIQLLIRQPSLHKSYSGYIFDSNKEFKGVDALKKALQLFSETKEQMGELTRKRIELITNKSFQDAALIDTKGKISIYRGRAGTGKTIGLIQTAIHLVDENQARVLLLTYNKALVSDIRRLFALAELPDLFEESCVSVNTFQSFFYKLINRVLYKNSMPGDKFISCYESVLKEFGEFLNEDEAVDIVRETMRGDEQLDWDYILIDEAQDWTNSERDIVLKIFDKGKVVVADGGNQFVRRGNVCDWSVVHDRNNIKLKYCLRQKANLISFLNVFSNSFEASSGKILSSEKMVGGKVVIISDEKLFDTHFNEMKLLKENGNIAYDMLYLVPHYLVSKSGGESSFSLKDKFEDKGISLWDGTNADNRNTYCISGDQVRVLQYDSARGLEGWTVVCLDFDAFMKEKEEEYVPGEVDSLLLESPEEREKKYLYNWAMIPLTRAIDTSVITLKDENSKYVQLFKYIADKYPEYVYWL